MREYVWLNERPVAVVDDVDTASPKLYHVHVDHLERPVMMTDASKAVVWEATFEPFGAVHAITGSASLNARFPGQWFMLESGLHYNWHRFYDPTTGRYTRPDPLGFVDGPSVYGYAGQSPLMFVDPDGRVKAPEGYFGQRWPYKGLLEGGGRIGGYYCPPPTRGTTARVGARPDNNLEYSQLNQAKKFQDGKPQPTSPWEKALEFLRIFLRFLP